MITTVEVLDTLYRYSCSRILLLDTHAHVYARAIFIRFHSQSVFDKIAGHFPSNHAAHRAADVCYRLCGQTY